MLGQGKTGPLLRPIGPPLSRIAPPHRRGLDLPRPPSIYVRRICRRQIAEPRSVLPPPWGNSEAQCEAYLPQANSRTAKRIAPARGNSEAQCEAYLPQANSRTAKRIAPARGNSEAPQKIPKKTNPNRRMATNRTSSRGARCRC